MSITPKAIQDLLDELESSKQSRLRAWTVLQRISELCEICDVLRCDIAALTKGIPHLPA
jgi:hypothetical protein